MAGNTERLDWGLTGQNLYAAIISRATGQYWNGTAMADYADGNWASYAVAMPETGTSATYVLTAPAALPAGDYDMLVRTRSGATPARSDAPVSALSDHWDGTNLTPLAPVAAAAAGDPWAAALPGAYAAGSAGNIVGTRVDAAISSRLAAAAYTPAPTAGAIDTQLIASHGTGAWNTVAPTTAAMDAALSTSHGSGAWNTVAPTAAAIDAALSGSHGNGAWNTVAPTAAAIDTQLSSTHGAGAWDAGAVGDGSIYGTTGTLSVVITELDEAGAPIPGVEVWISRDETGVNRTQSESTDDLGQARFRLDPQDAFLWREQPGRSWDPNPLAITIGP